MNKQTPLIVYCGSKSDKEHEDLCARLALRDMIFDTQGLRMKFVVRTCNNKKTINPNWDKKAQDKEFVVRQTVFCIEEDASWSITNEDYLAIHRWRRAISSELFAYCDGAFWLRKGALGCSCRRKRNAGKKRQTESHKDKQRARDKKQIKKVTTIETNKTQKDDRHDQQTETETEKTYFAPGSFTTFKCFFRRVLERSQKLKHRTSAQWTQHHVWIAIWRQGKQNYTSVGEIYPSGLSTGPSGLKALVGWAQDLCIDSLVFPRKNNSALH